MSKELPKEQEDVTPIEQEEWSYYSKELQILLNQRPELQQWRDEIIAEQKEWGEEEKEKYSSLSIPESLSRFFVSLPHTTTGWMIRALSPENALLRSDRIKHLKIEQRPYVVIDPFRIGNLWRQHWSFLLREVKNKDDMSHMVTAVRGWLLRTQPILSGRVILGQDGRVGRFQEIKKAQIGKASQKNPKLVPSNRAYLTVHHDLYGLLNSQQYARNHLDHGRRTIEEITNDVAQLIAKCVEKKIPSLESLNRDSDLVELVRNIQSRVKVRGSFFYIEKLMIDYLLKLDGGQHDSTRVYWAAKTLQSWLKDRIGKSAGIKEQVILLELGKNVELYHWKHKVLGAKKGKVDIFEVLEDISADFPGFKARLVDYVPLKEAPVFNPFFSFYREWKSFWEQNSDTPLEAQQRVARQYILITLQEIKTRYAYNNDTHSGEIASLKKRMETLEKLRWRFFSDKPEIVLDFWAEKTTINESLKKEITRYK